MTLSNVFLLNYQFSLSGPWFSWVLSIWVSLRYASSYTFFMPLSRRVNPAQASFGMLTLLDFMCSHVKGLSLMRHHLFFLFSQRPEWKRKVGKINSIYYCNSALKQYLLFAFDSYLHVAQMPLVLQSEQKGFTLRLHFFKSLMKPQEKRPIIYASEGSDCRTEIPGKNSAQGLTPMRSTEII